MKIGIILNSRTGHTQKVAEELKAGLTALGHSASIERVTPTEEVLHAAASVTLKTIPDCAAYDALVFAAWVMGGKLSPTMAEYLRQIKPLNGKRVCCFLTQFFPWVWKVEDSAMDVMKQLIESKGGNIAVSETIGWASFKRGSRIKAVERGDLPCF